MRKNIIIDTDAYKLTHHLQYPSNLTKLYSYGEPRVGGKYPFVSFFGLQMIIEDHFLQVVTDEMIEEAAEESASTFGTPDYFNRGVWEKVRDLGHLPIRIRAVPEGTKIKISNALFTLESTEPWFASTLNALESTLMHVWYPTTIATRAMYIKEGLAPFFANTSDIGDFILPVAVNDFGYRGATSHETAARGGAAFMVHFVGSDNMPANRALKDYYGLQGRLKSVWATEHSVATSYSSGKGEFDYINAQLDRSEDDKIISIVIDSYDSDNFIQNIVGNEEIKKKIKAKSGRVVFRPDSGIPLRNVLKYSDMLGGIFGYSINSKGYKVINSNVGLLQGDGMDEASIIELYRNYTESGWAADNIITGSGGGLLQVDANRDTSRWAIKASYGETDGGVGFNIQKNPKTDVTKASKTGKLKVLRMGHDSYMTISSANDTSSQFNGYIDSMETVLQNGVFKKDTFENILNRAK
jgi:nicotinamide phosphoribosyltransferase